MAAIGIGPFDEGEVPSALQYQFSTVNDTPLSLAGGTATFEIGGDERAATIFDAPNGIVEYQWEPEDITSGVTPLKFTVVQGDVVTKSEPMVLLCR